MQVNRKSLIVAALLALGAAGTQAAVNNSATFQVKMTITSACAVTTAPGTINLGTAVASTTAVTNNSSTQFGVTCSKGTPFYVGLAPSNANTAGAGVMSGTGSNTDKVPYTLYQDSAFKTPWGNTATSTSVGNGESGTGLGMGSESPKFTVYAQAVNSNFTPDNYTDTVTVNVNY